MSMSKITVNLSEQDVRSMISKEIKGNFDSYSIKSITFNMTTSGFDRHESYGHKFTGADVELEITHKYGMADR